VVIDLPRLATALRQRVGHWSDTPPPAGVPLAWPCRGCGSPLDPSREVSCGACGHGVVAPSLLDVTPLLSAIEHELNEAARAARPYRRKPPRPHTWRETGLGMLERLWRGLGPEPEPAARWTGVLGALAVLTLIWLLMRR
jgi:hypothetical protein